MHKSAFCPGHGRYLCVSLALFTEEPTLETFNDLYRDISALLNDISIGMEMRLKEFGDWLDRV